MEFVAVADTEPDVYETMFNGIKAICEEIHGVKIEIPDDEDVVECRVFFPASETPVLQVCHKQEYPHNTHNCSSIADIAKTILHINSIFVEPPIMEKSDLSSSTFSIKKSVEKRYPPWVKQETAETEVAYKKGEI